MKAVYRSFLLVLVIPGAIRMARAQVTVRPLLDIGLSIRPPSSTEPGYVTVNGGSYGNYSVNRFIYGGGVQMLFGPVTNPSSDHTLRFGLHLRWQKPYSSVFDAFDEDEFSFSQAISQTQKMPFGSLDLLNTRLQAGVIFSRLGLNRTSSVGAIPVISMWHIAMITKLRETRKPTLGSNQPEE